MTTFNIRAVATRLSIHLLFHSHMVYIYDVYMLLDVVEIVQTP
jgi:hypothetical protein